MSPPMELHLLGVCFPELIPPHFNPHRRVCKSHCCHRYLLKTAYGAARRGVRGGGRQSRFIIIICAFLQMLNGNQWLRGRVERNKRFGIDKQLDFSTRVAMEGRHT